VASVAQPRPWLRHSGPVRLPVDARVGKVVRLGHNERVTPLPEDLVRRIFAGIGSEELTALPELEPLYSKLSSYVDVDRDCLLVCHGADGGIAQVYEAYVIPGDKVLRPQPTYHRYAELASIRGAEDAEVPFDRDFRVDVTALLERIDDATKLVVLVNPDSPTGSALSEGEVDDVAERARRHNALLLVDEVYHHFCDVTAVPLARQRDNVVVARSFSKAFGIAGVRVGFLVAARELIGQLRKVKPRHEISSVAARIAEGLLDHIEVMEEYVASVKAARPRLAAALLALGFEMVSTESAGAMVRLPDGLDRGRLAVALLENGYEISAGLPAPYERYIRVTIGPWHVMEGFVETLAAVTATVASSHGADTGAGAS
jgi:histidinol-phosphate aminotransferase